MKVLKKILLPLFMALALLAFAGSAIAGTSTKASADSVFTLKGASIRYVTTGTAQGIRFVAVADSDEFATVTANNNVTIGMIIVSADNLKIADIAASDLNPNSSVFKHNVSLYSKVDGVVNENYFSANDDGDMETNAYIWGIPENAFALEWVAKLYYQVNNGAYQYSDNVLQKSISQVAVENYDTATPEQQAQFDHLIKNYDINFYDTDGTSEILFQNVKFGDDFTVPTTKKDSSAIDQLGYETQWIAAVGSTGGVPIFTGGVPYDFTEKGTKSAPHLAFKLNLELIQYSITYNLNGGVNNSKNTHTSYNVNSSKITIYAPTRSGYTFAGWYVNDSTTTTATPTINAGSTGDMVYTANWTENKIVFNKNGGQGSMANQLFDKNTTVTLTVNNGDINNETNGLYFMGWATSSSRANSGIVDYANGAQYTCGTSSTYTLYAVWAKLDSYNGDATGGVLGDEVSYNNNLFYTNEELKALIPDPFVLDDTARTGYYYAYGTEGDFVCYRSKDITNWEVLGSSLGFYATGECSDREAIDNRIWAPETFYDEDEGKYFMIFSATPKDRSPYTGSTYTGNPYYVQYLATSANPWGPFKLVDFSDAASCGAGNTHSYTRKYDGTYFAKYAYFNPDTYYETAKAKIEAKGYTFASENYVNGFLNGIDLTAFVDPQTGYKYLYWCANISGSYGQKKPGNMIFGVRMTNWYKPDWSTLEIVSVAGFKNSGNYGSNTVNPVESGTACNEGPQMTYNSTNKLYTLTLSFAGYAHVGYSLMQAYSISPLGTFYKLDQDTQNGVFLSSGWASINGAADGTFLNKEVTGPGHHAMVYVGNSLYVAYHRHNVPYKYINSNGCVCTACAQGYASNPGTCTKCGGTSFQTGQRVNYGGTGARYLALDELKWVTLSTTVKNASNQTVNIQALYCNGPTNSVQNKPGELTGYYNIAGDATVTKVSGTLKSGSSMNYMKDGYVPIYNQYVGQSFMSTYNIKETEITANTTFKFHFSSPRSVVGFLVYNSRTYANIFKTISGVKITYVRGGQSYTRAIDNITFSSKYYEGNYISLGSAAFTSFNELQVTDIQFTVEKPSGASTVGIGEVKILGKQGTTADSTSWDYNPEYTFSNMSTTVQTPDADMTIDGLLNESDYSSVKSLSWSYTSDLNNKTVNVTITPVLKTRGIYLGATLTTNDSTFRYNKQLTPTAASGIYYFVSLTTTKYVDTYKFYVNIGGEVTVYKNRRYLNSTAMVREGAWVDVNDIEMYNTPYAKTTYTGTINSNATSMTTELYIPNSFFGKTMNAQAITSYYLMPGITTLTQTTPPRYVNANYSIDKINREDVICGEHLGNIDYSDPTTWYQVNSNGFKVRNINVTKTGSGNVVSDTGFDTFVAGKRIVLKVTPASGYYLSAFTVGGSDAMGSLTVEGDSSTGYYGLYSTITSDADVNVNATFTALNSSKTTYYVQVKTSGVTTSTLFPYLSVYLTRGNCERINGSYNTSTGKATYTNLNYGTYTVHVYHNTRHYELINATITVSGSGTYNTSNITADMVNTFVLGDTIAKELGRQTIIDLSEESGVNFGESFTAKFFIGTDYNAISTISETRRYCTALYLADTTNDKANLAIQLLKWDNDNTWYIKMNPDAGNNYSQSWTITGDNLAELKARNGLYIVLVATTHATAGMSMDVYVDLGGGNLSKLGTYVYPVAAAGHAFWVANIDTVSIWALEGVDATRLASIRDLTIKANTANANYFNSGIKPSVLVEGGIDSITGLASSYSLGNTVTFTVKPSSGYSVAIARGNGNVLSATDNGNGTFTYSFRATCGALIYVKGVPSAMDVSFVADSDWDADGATIKLSSATTGYSETVTVVGNEAVFTDVITGASDYVLSAEIFGSSFVLKSGLNIFKSNYELDFTSVFANGSLDKDDVNVGTATFTHKRDLTNENFMVNYNGLAASNKMIYGAKFKIDPDDYQKVKTGILPEIRIGINLSREGQGSPAAPTIKVEKNRTIINLIGKGGSYWGYSVTIPEVWMKEMLYGNGMWLICEQTLQGLNIYVGNDFDYTLLLVNPTDDYTFAADNQLLDVLPYAINQCGPYFWTTVNSTDISYSAQAAGYKLIYGTASATNIATFFGATRTTKVAISTDYDTTKGDVTVTAATSTGRVGSQFTVDVAPKSGYVIDSVTINGVTVAQRCLSYNQVFAKFTAPTLDVVATFVAAATTGTVTIKVGGLDVSGVTAKLINVDTGATTTATLNANKIATFTNVTTANYNVALVLMGLDVIIASDVSLGNGTYTFGTIDSIYYETAYGEEYSLKDNYYYAGNDGASTGRYYFYYVDVPNTTDFYMGGVFKATAAEYAAYKAGTKNDMRFGFRVGYETTVYNTRTAQNEIVSQRIDVTLLSQNGGLSVQLMPEYKTTFPRVSVNNATFSAALSTDGTYTFTRASGKWALTGTASASNITDAQILSTYGITIDSYYANGNVYFRDTDTVTIVKSGSNYNITNSCAQSEFNVSGIRSASPWTTISLATADRALFEALLTGAGLPIVARVNRSTGKIDVYTSKDGVSLFLLGSITSNDDVQNAIRNGAIKIFGAEFVRNSQNYSPAYDEMSNVYAGNSFDKAFSGKNVTINKTVGTGGSVTNNTPVVGGTLTINVSPTITPNLYELSSLTVNGTEMKANVVNNVLTLNNVYTETVNIVASFVKATSLSSLTVNVYNHTNFTANGVSVTITKQTDSTKTWTRTVTNNQLSITGATIPTGVYNVTAVISGLTVSLGTIDVQSTTYSTLYFDNAFVQGSVVRTDYVANNKVSINLGTGTYSKIGGSSYLDCRLTATISNSFYAAMFVKGDVTGVSAETRFGFQTHNSGVTAIKGANAAGFNISNMNQTWNAYNTSLLSLTTLKNTGYWVVLHQDLTTGNRTVYLSDETCSYLYELPYQYSNDLYVGSFTNFGISLWENEYTMTVSNFRCGSTIAQVMAGTGTVSISTNNPANATVNLSATSVTAGTPVTYKVTPNAGYQLSGLTLNNTDFIAKAVSSGTTLIPLANCTFSATISTIASRIDLDDTTISGHTKDNKVTIYNNRIGVTDFTWQGFVGLASAPDTSSTAQWQVSVFFGSDAGERTPDIQLLCWNGDVQLKAFRDSNNSNASAISISGNADLMSKLAADYGLTIRIDVKDGKINTYVLGGTDYTVWYQVHTGYEIFSKSFINKIYYYKNLSTISSVNAVVKNASISTYVGEPANVAAADATYSSAGVVSLRTIANVRDYSENVFTWSGLVGFTNPTSTMWSTTNEWGHEIKFWDADGNQVFFVQLLEWSGNHVYKLYNTNQGFQFHASSGSNTNTYENYLTANGGVYIAVSYNRVNGEIKMFMMNNTGEWRDVLTTNLTSYGAKIAAVRWNTYQGNGVLDSNVSGSYVKDQVMTFAPNTGIAVANKERMQINGNTGELGLQCNVINFETGYTYHFVSTLNFSSSTYARNYNPGSKTFYAPSSRIRWYSSSGSPAVNVQILNWAGGIYLKMYNVDTTSKGSTNTLGTGTSSYKQFALNSTGAYAGLYKDWLAGLYITIDIMMYMDASGYMWTSFDAYDAHGVKYSLGEFYRPMVSISGTNTYWDQVDYAKGKMNGFHIVRGDKVDNGFYVTANGTVAYRVAR